ncbi:MAG: glycosyltransferase family 4 protein [Candidatus Omnitrophota bacterium]
MMRILMVHPHDIYSPVEPWTRRIKCLAQELVCRGNEVKLVYFPLSFKEKLHKRYLDGYEVIPLSRYPSPRSFIKNTLKLINLVRWAEIVHFQKCHHYASIPAVISAYLMGKHLHYDWDDWEEEIWYESSGKGIHSRFIGFSFKILERFLPLLADTVSVSSEHLKKLAMSFGVKEDNISIIPVGADLNQFNPHIDGGKIRIKYNIDAPLVLYVGQLHGAQYIDLFIKAANIVLHKNPQVYFMIVGEGFMEKRLRRLTKELGIENKVIFTGSVPHHEIPEYISASDICVAPFKETKVTLCKSPLKIVEYMASGKAIVASNVGEVRKMVGGVGILVEPGNFYALAEGILKLLKDEELRINLGKLARKRAEGKYNWKVSTSTLISMYNQ